MIFSPLLWRAFGSAFALRLYPIPEVFGGPKKICVSLLAPLDRGRHEAGGARRSKLARANAAEAA
jgi:hypothetical protein